MISYGTFNEKIKDQIMAFDEKLADRARVLLFELESKVEEKAMFGGLCFMVKGKMCIGIFKDELMCRVDPEQYEGLLDIPGCHTMDMAGRVMKGYILIDPEYLRTTKELKKWVNICLEFNPKAKASKKR